MNFHVTKFENEHKTSYMKYDQTHIYLLYHLSLWYALGTHNDTPTEPNYSTSGSKQSPELVAQVLTELPT